MKNPFGQYNSRPDRPFSPLDWGLALSEGPLARRQRDVVKILSENRIGNIFDYGAGFGAFILELLSNNPFANYFGVDADPEAFAQTLELARRLTGESQDQAGNKDSNQGAQNILAQLMRKKYKESRAEKILRARKNNSPRGLEEEGGFFNFTYGNDEQHYTVSFLEGTLPLDGSPILSNAHQSNPHNWAITAIGITENLTTQKLPDFFESLKKTLGLVVADLIVISYLDPLKQKSFGGVMQNTMARIGPSIFNAKPPTLNAHGGFITRCQQQLLTYTWESVASVGARCYAVGRKN